MALGGKWEAKSLLPSGFEYSGGCKLLILNGAPGKTRTCGLLIRSQTLYPTELRAHPFRLNKLQQGTGFRNCQIISSVPNSAVCDPTL